jgi:hypothetical protein
MIHTYKIKHNDWREVREWLVENIGNDGYRWWTTDANGSWNGVTANWERDKALSIEVTEDEEPMLTTFILKYA